MDFHVTGDACKGTYRFWIKSDGFGAKFVRLEVENCWVTYWEKFQSALKESR